jgi:FixJ family two-component response regulator
MPQNAPVVYVVDDDVSMREALESLIRSEDWRVEIFSSATEFFARPPFSGPSCLVLDVTLPDLNGLDLVQRIGPDRVDMPIILITGYSDPTITALARKAGALEVLTKPFDDEALLGPIRQAFERNVA